MLRTVLNEKGEINPDALEQATELTRKIAKLCKDEEPLIVLFVLEAALTAHISAYEPALGDLFSAMMRSYKEKAAVIIHMMEALEADE